MQGGREPADGGETREERDQVPEDLGDSGPDEEVARLGRERQVLTEGEANLIMALPPELQETETAFLLSQCQGVRDTWAGFTAQQRQRFAARRQHLRAGEVRERWQGGRVAGGGEWQGVGAEAQSDGGGQGYQGARAEEQNMGAAPGQVLPDTQLPIPLPGVGELPTLEELHSTLVPTRKWCPKGARGDFARELGSLWNRLADNPGELQLWKLVAMFPRVILPAGRGPRAGDSCSQSKIVKERLRRWRQGEFTQLWEDAKNLTKEF